MSCENAQKPCNKVSTTDSDKFVIYKSVLPNIYSLLNKYLSTLHADLAPKDIFPRKSITIVC